MLRLPRKHSQASSFGAAAIVLIACISCARSPEPLIFHNPLAKPGQFERDRYECLQQSQQPLVTGSANAYRANHLGEMVTNRELMIACMAARGYERTNDPPKPGTSVIVKSN